MNFRIRARLQVGDNRVSGRHLSRPWLIFNEWDTLCMVCNASNVKRQWKPRVVVILTLSSLGLTLAVVVSLWHDFANDDKVGKWRNEHWAIGIKAMFIATCINLLWPKGPTWRHRSGSTLAKVMVWYLTAPNHYLNQYLLLSLVKIGSIHMRTISQLVRRILFCTVR